MVRAARARTAEANELTVDLFAVLAQHERRIISERTKAALAAAKRRGVKLGGHVERISRAAARRGSAASAALRADRALAHARAFAPTIRELRGTGATSLHAIARALNDRDMPAPRGGQWAPAQVGRLVTRIEGDSRSR